MARSSEGVASATQSDPPDHVLSLPQKEKDAAAPSQRRDRLPTRERLIAAGMSLFAERGFRATTIGDIERVVGLTPRRGGAYKHFKSKRELFEAGLERHIRELQTMAGVMDLLPLGDARSAVVLLVRWFLQELDRQRFVCLVLEKEGEAYPDLRERFFNEVIQVGYRHAAELTRRSMSGMSDGDAEVMTSVIVGAIVNYRRTEWTFGKPPLEMDEVRFVDGIVDFVMRLFSNGGTQ